jgi:hypothetical protein
VTDHTWVKGAVVSVEDLAQFDEMGPVDYAILEWPRGRPPAEAGPMIVDLVERGLIRLLDVAFVAKNEDGSITALDLEHQDAGGVFADFEGASSGLLDFTDLEDAGSVLEPGSSAVVLVWENRFLAPLAVALRKSGAQMVAHGRIPIQALLGSLEALEAEAAT